MDDVFFLFILPCWMAAVYARLLLMLFDVMDTPLEMFVTFPLLWPVYLVAWLSSLRPEKRKGYYDDC